MNLPRPEDLKVEGGTDEERAEAISAAIRTVELLTGCAVLERALHADIYLGGTSPFVILDHYPIRGFRVDGHDSPQGFWVEPSAGIVGVFTGEVPAASYRVDFCVGCGKEVPAILELLIVAVAEHILGAGPPPEEILDVSASAAALRDLAREDRARHKEKTV